MASSLSSRTFKDKIFEHVVKKPSESRPAETDHQLYVLQSLILNTLDERRTTRVDPQDEDSMGKISDLRRIAFDSDGGAFSFGSSLELNGGGKKEKPNCSRDYQRLGFQNDINPTQDFRDTPPGILALDCMYYLATNHVELYNKIVLETACRGTGDECPFARSSIALTSVLCDILCIGETPKEQEGKFYTFFFQHK
ncbi:unnamed protein product [Allacma fusca]|uniref:ELMO domain-containing protein n=1 Tax=Allacma fusca TaxID=39272 RepID=A0A8J2P0K4_9HEXA|nr:unnamed protein product [Allacma fusca]